jgi:3-methyl-2-oxobutanoate hydroxymethyltransferase
MPDQVPAAPTTASTRVTLRTLRQWVREARPFAMLTCYDATTARWLWRGGVRCLLVGDTAAQVILGHDSTLPATMPFMLEITAAVRRGAPDAFVMADMPLGSYQCGDDAAVRHACAFLARGGADAVKLEVDASFAPLVERLGHAGVPVVAHLGSRPQMVRAQGGYQSAGRTPAEAALLVDAAERMIHAGAAMLLLEAVPDEVARKVVHAATSGPAAPGRAWPVPVVGCGGGPACHGHVVVLQDLLGLSAWQPPFAPPMTDLGAQIQAAAARWNELVQSGRYLRDDHPYKMQG